VTPTVAILFTGGTISMRIDTRSGSAVPAMRGDDILAHVPQLADVADIELEDVAQLPGPHVTPEHMWRLARRVAAWLERPDIDGVVVTHGTDTLEETAYFLDIALRTDKPVVLVGAIRTMSEPSWDGPANLVHAVQVAGSPASRARGVMVAMNEQILSAREVEKVHTEAAASFQSREFGPVGVVDAGVVRYLRSSPREAGWFDAEADGLLRVRRIDPDVDLIKVAAGADGRYVRCSMASGTRGWSSRRLAGATCHRRCSTTWRQPSRQACRSYSPHAAVPAAYASGTATRAAAVGYATWVSSSPAA
jgi:L-asparaginase